MNTQIYLWIEPMVMNRERCSDKVYFNCIVKGDHAKSEAQELEELIQGATMSAIMDFADIDTNWNYGVVSAKTTNKKPVIEFSQSPESRVEEIENAKTEKTIQKVVDSKKPIELTDKNVEIQDGGMIKVSVPSLRIDDKIDFRKIWDSLEKNFIGKIKEGDTVTLTDDNGNVIFEMIGGSFLNVGLADMSIYDAKLKPENVGLMNFSEGLKGGVFLRKDGSLDIGDYKRTFYLKIYTNNLLKASMKLKKSLMEITKMKLLK
jgi:hypothetical protein